MGRGNFRAQKNRIPKHTPLQGEAYAASGPPKTEAHAASKGRGSTEAHAASYLDTPSPPSVPGVGEAAEAPPWELEPVSRPREWSRPAMVEMAYTPELRKLYCEAMGADADDQMRNAQ